MSDVIGYESESNNLPTSIFAILSGEAISHFDDLSYTTKHVVVWVWSESLLNLRLIAQRCI